MTCFGVLLVGCMLLGLVISRIDSLTANAEGKSNAVLWADGGIRSRNPEADPRVAVKLGHGDVQIAQNINKNHSLLDHSGNNPGKEVQHPPTAKKEATARTYPELSHARHRRASPVRSQLAEGDIRETLGLHNSFRRWAKASNMEFMIWNEFLADMAQEWAEECLWEHGQPKRDPADVPYDPLGQNLFFSTGRLNITHAIGRWHDEIDYYNYNSTQCDANRMCGHYTQIVWGRSREIGCGYHTCDELTDRSQNKVYRSAVVYACTYGPAGNFLATKPFKKGDACTACDSGQGWCDVIQPRGLCRRDCNVTSEDCACRAQCQNGGAVDCDCRCQCPAGWTGQDCSDKCEEHHEYCIRGWPKTYCLHEVYGAGIRQNCPILCGLCVEESDNSTLPNICEAFVESTTMTSPEPTTMQTTTPPGDIFGDMLARGDTLLLVAFGVAGSLIVFVIILIFIGFRRCWLPLPRREKTLLSPDDPRVRQNRSIEEQENDNFDNTSDLGRNNLAYQFSY